jgi:hypothetical protein
MRRRVWVWAALLLLPGRLVAQVDCTLGHLPGDSHEAQTMAIFEVPLAFAPAGPPESPGWAFVRVSLEVAYLPEVDRQTATPTYCRPVKGPEHTDLLFAFPRPRVAIGLPLGLLVEASWVPPVRLNGVKADLFGVSIARSFGLGAGGTVLAFRGHTTLGTIHAPITCDEKAILDASSECFGQPVSNDRFRPNIFGGDVTLGFQVANGALRPYVGGGLNVLHPRFLVSSTRQKVEANLTRGVLFGGVGWAPTPGLELAGEVYSALADAVTGRVTVRYEFRE